MKSTSIISKKKSGAEKKIVNDTFPIVAIGASAGGLEAITELLGNLPSDTGMAFIYVQHLSPDHKSMLTSLLTKATKMKVQEIDDMEKIKPDNVFVIPYDKAIEVIDGRIKLIPRSRNSRAVTIDILFTSLAEAQKERVIGIVLSGSATDGTHGMKAIKYHGGLTFAQDDSAKFASMPHSAIAAGAVDFILSPKEIAHELLRLSKHPFIKTIAKRGGEEDLIDNNDPALKNILRHIRKSTGVDFDSYKMNTIKRRILRRMLMHKTKTLEEYLNVLVEKKEEIDILYQDLLINVTSFFRDTDTHKYLKTTLFPTLLKRKATRESLRLWVPACATGEEPYSIAMMLIEIQESKFMDTSVQIFATDLSEQAISKARIGIYSKQELEMVSPKRIQRFFTKSDGSYRVNKNVRDMCVFAKHDILRDPPFSRLDFISCCNLFIYLDVPAQKKAINTFHYALNEGGFLMLGKSENISHSNRLFTTFNTKFKIFSRKTNTGTSPALSPGFTQKSLDQTPESPGKDLKERTNSRVYPSGIDEVIDAVLLSDYMPAAVVINQQMEILQFRGATDLYLTHPKGKATFNILKMARPDLAFELRSIMSKAIKTKQLVRKSGIEIKAGTGIKSVSIEVVPLKIKWEEPLMLVLFTESELTQSVTQQAKGGKKDLVGRDKRIEKLQAELAVAHAEALNLTQEQEAYVEELQSANEEVVSSNEELQTINEELETSKEEIESTNEELITTNQELQTRNELLNESYAYSEAIISTMYEPMIVLDKHLRVKSANKAFYKKFEVTEEETEGVLLYELGNKQWNIPKLRKLLEDIIPTNSQFTDFEVTHTFLDIGEKIMSLNASRVVQQAHREQLILLVFADLTEVKHLLLEKELREKEVLNKEIRERKAEKEKLEKAVQQRTQELGASNETLRRSEERYHRMVKEVKEYAILYLNPEGIIENWNEGAEKIKGYNAEEIIGKHFSIFYTEEDKKNKLPESLLKEAIKKGTASYEGWRIRKDGGMFWAYTLITALHDNNNQVIGFSKVTRDLTDKKKADEAIKAANEDLSLKNAELKKVNAELEAFAYVSSHDLQEPLRKIRTFTGRLLEIENKNLSAKGKDMFQRIQESSARMQRLIQDLLAFSRLSNPERNFEITDLNKIVEQTKADLKEVILEKNATIEVEATCEVKIIPFQFQQLMQNLISNALKFSDAARPPHIIIKSRNIESGNLPDKSVPPNKQYCHITVSDNGIGFENQFRYKIFEVFQKLYGKDEYEGTGIGLAIVKKIVENHNGLITATGELNKGAHFDIYIPAT